jgi:hypothetical protein
MPSLETSNVIDNDPALHLFNLFKNQFCLVICTFCTIVHLVTMTNDNAITFFSDNATLSWLQTLTRQPQADKATFIYTSIGNQLPNRQCGSINLLSNMNRRLYPDLIESNMVPRYSILMNTERGSRTRYLNDTDLRVLAWICSFVN